MKKASVLGVLAGLVLVAVLYYFVARRPTIRPTAATLVPGESLAFLYLPDVARSAKRWQESSIHAIFHEPEVQAFMGSAARESGRLKHFKSYLARVAELEPQEAFLNLRSLDGDKPQFVAGLRFTGDKAKLEALVKEAGDYVRTLAPTGTADLVQRGSKTIETFTSEKITLATTFHEDWYLIGSSVSEIEQTLMRFRGDEKDSLAKSEAFRKSMTHLPAEFDTLAFLQPAALADRLAGLFGAAGMSGQEEKLAHFRRIEAIAASTKMDGPRMRDSVLTLLADRPEPVQLNGRTARFASPQALLYYAAAIQALPEALKPDQNAMNGLGLVPLFALLESTLAAQQVSASDLPKALGPEIGIALDWPGEGGTPQPTLAVEVRDRGLAEKFVAALIDPRLSGFEASTVKEGGVTYYMMPETPYGRPTLALTDQFLVLGLNQAALAKSLKDEGETLAATESYKSAMARLPEPDIATGYIDARAAFERLYGTVRPMLIMMGALGTQGGQSADFGKLPETETIAKHLGPIAVSRTIVDGGILLESEGRITANQALGGVGATVAWLAGPLISSRLQESLGTLSGGLLSLPGSSPAPPAAVASPTPEATPLQTPGYVSPVPGTLQDTSVNPPIAEPTVAPTLP